MAVSAMNDYTDCIHQITYYEIRITEPKPFRRFEHCPCRHHRQHGIDGKLVTHGGIELKRLPEEVCRRPTPKKRVTPFAFENAPAHIEEADPCQDAERKSETPNSQVFKRIQMRATHPLKIPWQVCIACCLNVLFLNIGDPLLVWQQTIEGIWLKDTEGDQRSETTRDEAGGDQQPVFVKAYH